MKLLRFPKKWFRPRWWWPLLPGVDVEQKEGHDIYRLDDRFWWWVVAVFLLFLTLLAGVAIRNTTQGVV